ATASLRADMPVSFSSEHIRNILKPRDKRRRQIDTCSKNKHQVPEHRHVRRLHRRPASHRLAEGESIEAQQKRTKRNKQTKYQDNREERFASERGAHHQKFAHEDAERRQADDGGHAKY